MPIGGALQNDPAMQRVALIHSHATTQSTRLWVNRWYLTSCKFGASRLYYLSEKLLITHLKPTILNHGSSW